MGNMEAQLKEIEENIEGLNAKSKGEPRLAERHWHAADGDCHEGPRDLREVDPPGRLSRFEAPRQGACCSLVFSNFLGVKACPAGAIAPLPNRRGTCTVPDPL